MKLVYGLMGTLVVLMILVLGGATAAYIFQGQFFFWEDSGRGAAQSIEWANFGTFLGGVAGPTLTVITGVLVAMGFVLQADAMSQAFKQSNREASHAALDWTRKKLDGLLERSLSDDGPTMQSAIAAHTLGLRMGLTAAEQKRLTGMLPELVYWLGAAVEQVGQFCQIQPEQAYTLRHERQYYRELHKFIEARQSELPGNLRITVGLIGTHFR